MKRLVIWVVVLVILFLGASLLINSPDESSDSQEEIIVVDTNGQEIDIQEPTTGQISGDLVDVSGGGSDGFAIAIFEDGKYNLVATFENLPDPEPEGYFYEGWVVRRSPSSVLSAGVARKIGTGKYENVFESSENLLDHDFYVLTIEPDDGDPSPAGHVLEGNLN